jgi:hypothetical protein
MDEDSDGRRRIFSKRKIESLEKDRSLLVGLVENLRDSNEIRLKKNHPNHSRRRFFSYSAIVYR